eukprot:PhM_4_TR14542/c0_g2_i1/m.60302
MFCRAVSTTILILCVFLFTLAHLIATFPSTSAISTDNSGNKDAPQQAYSSNTVVYTADESIIENQNIISGVRNVSTTRRLEADLADGGLLRIPRSVTRAAYDLGVAELQTFPRPSFLQQLQIKGVEGGEDKERDLVLWHDRTHEGQQQDTLPAPHARVACLYTGFVRDFARMVRQCRYGCGGEVSKYFGSHREHLWTTTKCDVFFTTWDMHGVGGYQQIHYTQDTSPEVDLVALAELMQPYLRVLHVENYTSHRYMAWFQHLARHRRRFIEVHPKDGKRARPFLRFNDYSQAYKMYVMALIMRQQQQQQKYYDAYIRVRPDIRFDLPVNIFRRGGHNSTNKSCSLDVEIGLTAPSLHRHRLPSPRGLLLAEKLPGDFAYVGHPDVVDCVLSHVWEEHIINGSKNNGSYVPARDPSSQRHADTAVMNFVMAYVFMNCTATATAVREGVIEPASAWARISRRAGATLHDLVRIQKVLEERGRRNRPLSFKLKTKIDPPPSQQQHNQQQQPQRHVTVVRPFL